MYICVFVQNFMLLHNVYKSYVEFFKKNTKFMQYGIKFTNNDYYFAKLYIVYKCYDQQ